MGGGESKIVNVNGNLREAGIINNNDKCNYILCSPNIAYFTNYKNNNIIINYNINNIIKIYLIFLMFIYIFIWIIIINKII